MSGQAVKLPDRPVFPRIEVQEVDVASETRPSFSVVRSADIAKADQGRQQVAEAWMLADEIVADAHTQAAAYKAQAKADSVLAQVAWYADQAALFDTRTAQAVDLLCRSTGQIAEAVIAAIFERMPLLPIHASVEIAVRLLRAEMRAHVLCHSLDFDAVSAVSASLGAALTQTDESVIPGELMFRDAQGEVRIDGTDAILQLLADWKTALSNALPGMPPQPAAMRLPTSPQPQSAADSFTTESEVTP